MNILFNFLFKRRQPNRFARIRCNLKVDFLIYPFLPSNDVPFAKIKFHKLIFRKTFSSNYTRKKRERAIGMVTVTMPS